MAINLLIRQRHKIARPHASLGWDVEASGRGLEDADAHHIANSQLDLRRGTIVTKDRRKGSRAIFSKDIDNSRRQIDEPIWRPVPSRAGFNAAKT